MISDITLGQFFPGFSTVHRLDPRTKILLATAFIVCVFLANNAVSAFRKIGDRPRAVGALLPTEPRIREHK